MTNTDIDQLRRTIDSLQRNIEALHKQHGDKPEVRRLRNDVERLLIDADDFAGPSAVPGQQRTQSRDDVVIIPDTPYDESLWEGADDEGVGGYHGERP